MKKACVGCAKQIPEAALHCVFCGAKQPSEPESGPAEPVSGEITVGEPAAQAAPAPTSSRAGVTLLGLRVEDLDKDLAPAPGEHQDEHEAQKRLNTGAAYAGVAIDATPVRGLPVLPEDPPPLLVERRAERRIGGPPFAQLTRILLGVSGITLLVLFNLPWRGTSSWQLIETLTGVDFVRQLYLLAGGGVLLLTALLPVPLAFRALVGATVAALPLVIAFASVLSGWHGVVAAVAVIALPATHLLRAPLAAHDRLGRAAVMLAALAVGLVYVLPISSVMPISYLVRLLGSMSVTHTVLGLFLGIPLVLAVLSLLGSLGRDLASVAVLLSLLILLWPPAAVLIFFADGTQYFVAVAILLTSTTTALSSTQLLSSVALIGSRART